MIVLTTLLARVSYERDPLVTPLLPFPVPDLSFRKTRREKRK